MVVSSDQPFIGAQSVDKAFVRYYSAVSGIYVIVKFIPCAKTQFVRKRMLSVDGGKLRQSI